MDTKRPTFDQIFMTMAHHMAMRSTCSRRSVGALIVSMDNRHVLGIGYNGGATGQHNGCDRPDESGNCGCLHAEENAIINCTAPRSVEKKIFTTVFPCPMCAKRIVNLGGVKYVYYTKTYHTHEAMNIFSEAGIFAYKIYPLMFQENNMFNFDG